MQKVRIYKEIENIYIIGESFDSIRDSMKSFEEKYPEYDSFMIEEGEHYGGGTCAYVVGIRMETDEEFEKRVNHQKERENKKKEEELKELARLKAKYEKA
jgi:hypothetical protein